MFNTSDIARDVECQATDERRSPNSRRRVFWSILFVIIGFALVSPKSAAAQWSTSGNDVSNTNTGNVGIGTGTTAPSYKLNVAGSEDKSQIRFGLGALDSGGFLFSNAPTHAVFSGGASWNGAWYAKAMNASSIQMNTGTITLFTNSGLTPNNPFTPTARMSIDASGNVGIGATPTSKLHVVSGTDSGTTLLSLDTGVHGGTSMAVFGTANNESGFDMSVYRAGVYTSRFGVNSAGNVYLQPSAGRVGLGTSTPDTFAKLHVYGSGGFGQDIQTTTNDWTRIRFVTPSQTWGFFLEGGGAGQLAQGAFGLYDYTASLWRMVFSTGGNVGVGTTTPGYKLDVQGGSINSSGGLCIAGDCKTAWSQVGGSSQWTTSGTTINYSLGNVGIGVAAPTSKLHVNGTVNATALSVNGTPVISSQWATSGTTINYAGGNVGIATAGPTEKLEINGNLKLTGTGNITAAGTIEGGNVKAKYQDVAEWVDSSQELSAGTVVILDSTRSNQVIASTRSYDSRVAGVISLQPGIVLGEEREGRVLVATTGRVKVKVDASNGPIQIGDLLVTSDREGFAMKSVPVDIGGIRMHRPGTLIGKTLEPLAQGTAEILVLLSLQ